MTEAIGPSFAAGFQAITKNGYPILFLPDANNDALQREGKPPVYHWIPNTVRLAQKENGDYKFSFLHFVGVRSESTTVGAVGTEEVAGALVGFSTTSAPPAAALQEACDELINRIAALRLATPSIDLESHPVTARLLTEKSPLADRAYKHREDLIDACLAAWTRLLADGGRREDVATALFASIEYRQALVEDFYLGILGRPADAAGLASWLGFLGAGGSEYAVAAAFMDSPEFLARL